MIARLESPLRRLVTIAGQEIVVELVPEDGGIPAHIKLRRGGDKKSFRTITLDPPSDGELRNR